MLGKLMGLGFMMLALYVGLELYTEGPNRAFGGQFSFMSAGDDMPERASHYVTRGDRVRTKVQAAMRQSESRYDNVVDD